MCDITAALLHSADQSPVIGDTEIVSCEARYPTLYHFKKFPALSVNSSLCLHVGSARKTIYFNRRIISR
jgi:hypothetical protein